MWGSLCGVHHCVGFIVWGSSLCGVHCVRFIVWGSLCGVFLCLLGACLVGGMFSRACLVGGIGKFYGFYGGFYKKFVTSHTLLSYIQSYSVIFSPTGEFLESDHNGLKRGEYPYELSIHSMSV